eukprot:g61418.t1
MVCRYQVHIEDKDSTGAAKEKTHKYRQLGEKTRETVLPLEQLEDFFDREVYLPGHNVRLKNKWVSSDGSLLTEVWGCYCYPKRSSYHSDKSDTRKKKLSQSASSSNGKSNQTDVNNILKKPYKNTGFPWICSEDPEQWFTVKLSLLNYLRQIQEEDRKVACISWWSAANASSAPEDWLESLADDAIWHQEFIKRYSDEHAWLDEPVLWQVEKVYTNAHLYFYQLSGPINDSKHCLISLQPDTLQTSSERTKHIRLFQEMRQTVNEDSEHKQVCFHYQNLVPVPPLGADTAAQSIGLSESHPVITPVSRHLPVYVKPTSSQNIDVRWNDTMSVVKIDHDYLDVTGKPVPTVTRDVLPVAFSKWEDFKKLIPKTDLKTHDSLDQATTRGTQLHNERATWLRSFNVNNKWMHAPPATADPVTLALFNYDSNFAAEGWIPVRVEAVVDNQKHGYAGTLDVLWYNSNLDSFTLDDLKASTYYSPTDRETIKCSRVSSIIKLLLLLVRAHKDLGPNKVNTVPCDFRPEAVAKLLEEWSAFGSPACACELPRKRQSKSGSTEAGEADLQTACQGGIDCKKQGGKHITVQEWNRHNTLCTEEARQFRIPQEFSPRMLTWIQDCLDAGHDVNTVIDSLYQENHDMFRHSGFPPRPLGATLPDNLRRKHFYDLEDFTSAEKLLQDKLQKDQFDLRKPECTGPRPAKGSGKRWFCSNDRCGLGGKRNKRFDVLLDVLIETMLRLLAPAMYDVSFDKARKHMAPVVIRAVRLRNNLQTMHSLEDKSSFGKVINC